MPGTARGYRRPTTLEFTRDPASNALVAQHPAAFVIGWILDQQIRVQQAFAGPLALKERLGTIEPHELAAMPVDAIIKAMTDKPPLHRYGGSMGKRVHDCMQFLVEHYDGDPERIWLEAADYADFRKRLLEVPGFGETKVPGVAAVLARRFGLELAGWETKLPEYGSLSDVEQYEDLVAYQARKREWKAVRRAKQAEAQAAD